MADRLKNVFANAHEKISVSIHESSHTIYGLLDFFPIIEVKITKDPDLKDRFEGLTRYDDRLLKKVLKIEMDSALTLFILKADICLSYAGLLGEELLFQSISGSNKLPKFLKNGVGNDTASAYKLIKKISSPGKQRYNLKKKLIKNTQFKLQKYWNDIMLLNHTLIENKRLSFDDLKELLIKKSENKEFWKNQFKTISYIYDNLDDLDEKEIKSILLT